MLPVLTDAQLDALDSRAEAQVYRACRDQLPDRVLCIHRAEWILRRPQEGASDGETDFVLCDPETGLVTLEVKGGGISFDPTTDVWISTDAGARRHRIKDPFRQARHAKFAVLSKLREHRRWPQCGVGKMLVGHAVLFPDVANVEPFCQARIPREILGSHADVAALDTWWDGVLRYWRSQNRLLDQPGPRVVALVEDIFARPAAVRRLLAARLADEEQAHIRLTDQQKRILGALSGHRRAAICGGAGTGKTLLAVEKAKRLAREGFRTLLLCYNRPLGDYLARVCQGIQGLEVASFHSLCSHRCAEASRLAGRDLLQEAASESPAGDLFDVQMPLALAYSVDVLHDRYDAMVVDEGQDFKEEYWFPLELLLEEPDHSPLYIFYDQNQALYTTTKSFPIRAAPYLLTMNCRNTRVIHDVSYQFFRGQATEPPEIEGLPVEVVTAPSILGQAQKVRTILNRLLVEEHVSPVDLVVLVADGANKAAYYDALMRQSIPRGLRWAPEDHQARDAIVVDTVHRFKGLEAPVTVLWMGELSGVRSRQ